MKTQSSRLNRQGKSKKEMNVMFSQNQTSSLFVLAMSAALLISAVVGGATISINQGTATVDPTIDIGALGTADWAIWTSPGAPAQQKAGASVIGDVQELGDTGAPFVASMATFTWASGGSPDASSTGFSAGFSSDVPNNGLAAGEGWRIGLTLPAETGTITFWGVTRQTGVINTLTIKDNGDNTLGSVEYSNALGGWVITPYTVTWENATIREQITLDWTFKQGAGNAARVGVAGIAGSAGQSSNLTLSSLAVG